METEIGTIRLLGIAQLAVFAASLISEQLLRSVAGSGDIPEILGNIARRLKWVRISNVTALLNSLAIIFLGAVFYHVFHKEYELIALLAFGCFVAESITLSISKLGAIALVPLSQEYVEAGVPGDADYKRLGDFFYHGIDRTGYNIHMLFFCIGAFLWYTLLHISGSIPRGISLWGLISVGLLIIPILLMLYKRELTQTMILGIFYAPFELVLGLWLVIKGFN